MSKETGKGRQCRIGKAPNAAGSRGFSAREARIE
jgi:hypothetical protein